MDQSRFVAISQRITDAADDDAKLAALQEYDAAFSEAVKTIGDATREVESIEDEVADLEKELAQLLADEAEVPGDATDDTTSDSGSTSCAAYYKFLTSRSAAMGEFQVLEAALTGVADGDATRVTGDWEASATINDTEWASKRADLGTRVSNIATLSTSIDPSVTADTTLDALNGLLKHIDEIRPKAVAAASAFAARCDGNKATRAEMEVERQGLLTWCRQQKTNLDAMVEPDHAQEFCSSMLANFASMDKNFQVLLDFTNQLPGDEVLQRDMLECNEVWLNLQVSAYERMRHALLEVHPKSKLEDEVREFVSFTDEVLDFVQKVKELFSSTNDPESDRFVRPVVEEADALLVEYGMHEGLPKQLQDFCNRMDCLRDSYSNLRRSVLSRLTFLTSSVPALTASMRRKEEYVARMKDLKAWVEVKSQGETWSDIHERILSIKALIEQEQASLNETKTA